MTRSRRCSPVRAFNPDRSYTAALLAELVEKLEAVVDPETGLRAVRTAYLTGDIGISIILLTIVIRTLLIPVFRAQIVSQRRMQMLQPELRAIQNKYKGDRQKISEEQMKLYREAGVNPMGGCLPMLVQLPILWAFLIIGERTRLFRKYSPVSFFLIGFFLKYS